MHAATVHLIPVLAAEKSKTPFYIAGGVLVAWALLVSLGLGLRTRGFPASLSVQRLLMGVTAVLVVAATAAAVATSGGSKAEASSRISAPPQGVVQQRQSGGEQSETGGTPSPPAATASTPTQARAQAKTKVGAPGVVNRRRRRAGGGGASSSKPAGAPASAPAGVTTLKESPVDTQLQFASTRLSAKAGKVTVQFTNASPLPHNFTLAQGAKVLGATPTFAGGVKTLTLTLKPGTYTFFCSVPGHRSAGMEGTLVVS